MPRVTSAQRASYRFTKRCLDLAISVPASILTLPLIAALAIGSAISFRAWPFFTQRRLGLNGQEFTFIKVRSLPATAPTAADKYVIGDLPNTAWGRFIRKTKLDELPQLWLVVAGTMSLVGPRPEMPELAATFDPEFVRERMTVKPGCTGLWQISEASAALIGEHPEYDLHYVRNASVRLDLLLIIGTLVAVTTGSSTETRAIAHATTSREHGLATTWSEGNA